MRDIFFPHSTRTLVLYLSIRISLNFIRLFLVVLSERNRRVATFSLSLQFCCVLGVVFDFVAVLVFSLVLFKVCKPFSIHIHSLSIGYETHIKCSSAVQFRAYLISLIQITQAVP